jgi:hypothetical protein
MIIGLLLGIVISLAVALWLNRLSNPFVEKGKRRADLEDRARAAAAPAEAAKAAEKAAKGEGRAGRRTSRREVAGAPRFEFYRSSRREGRGEKDAAAAPKATPPAAPRAKPGSSPRAQAHLGRDLLAAGRRLLRRARG